MKGPALRKQRRVRVTMQLGTTRVQKGSENLNVEKHTADHEHRVLSKQRSGMAAGFAHNALDEK